MLYAVGKRQIRNNAVFLAKRFTSSNPSNVDNTQTKAPSPVELVKESHFPKIDNPDLPNRDISAKAKLEKPAYEKEGFKVPAWKRAFGETFVSLFHIDMDNVRAGTISGSKYYYMCKDQGLQFTDEELSETAKFWYETLGLPRTFAMWFQITNLHVWLLFVRMRAMPFKIGKNYQQKLVDKMFKDIELRLSEEMNVLSGRIRDTYMKDFHSQMLGMIFSLDEALAQKNDDVLAAAVWRNIFNGDKNIDIVKLEAIVRYIRMQLYVLDNISDRAFGFGDFQFVGPNETVDLLSEEDKQQLLKMTKMKYEPENGKILPSHKSQLSLEE
ncbi:Cbp3 protein [Pichia kluyveri]|uniref:Cbp3 protein n=1 Tax=Pichia kluyveri TaxID=36015 RepID=A0AAV5R7P7_PICKL|nr:Cbp3 protein [Pichia kluyveri]